MSNRTVSGVMLTLLLTGMLMLAFNIQPVKAEPKTPEKRVLFDMLHVEQFAFWWSYSKLSSELRSNGYVLYQLGREIGEVGVGEITYDLLTNFDILVLPNPQCVSPVVHFKNSEADAILKFVQEGGGLLVLEGSYPQHDDWYSVKEIIKQFGIEYEVPIVEMDPHVTDIISHSVTIGVNELLLAWRPKALNVSSPAEAVAYSQGKPVIAVSEYGDGKVVVISSSHIFCSEYIQQYDNLAFSLNVFQWLSEPGIEHHPLELPLIRILNWNPPSSMIVGKVYRVNVEIQNYGVAQINVTTATLDAPVFNETGHARGDHFAEDSQDILLSSNTSMTTNLDAIATGIGYGTKEEVNGYTYMSIIIYTSFYSSYLVADGRAHV